MRRSTQATCQGISAPSPGGGTSPSPGTLTAPALGAVTPQSVDPHTQVLGAMKQGKKIKQ